MSLFIATPPCRSTGSLRVIVTSPNPLGVLAQVGCLTPNHLPMYTIAHTQTGVSYWKGSDHMGTRPLEQTVRARGRRARNQRARPEVPNFSEEAFQQIRQLIVRGKLAPGSRVVEADLADRLGVSRTPVRAALHRLQ